RVRELPPGAAQGAGPGPLAHADHPELPDVDDADRLRPRRARERHRADPRGVRRSRRLPRRRVAGRAEERPPAGRTCDLSGPRPPLPAHRRCCGRPRVSGAQRRNRGLMGRLIYLMNVSLDGYTETADHRLDWTLIDDELHSWFNGQMEAVDASLYGRRLY